MVTTRRTAPPVSAQQSVGRLMMQALPDMNGSRLGLSTIICAALLSSTAVVGAQSTGSLAASATVLAPALTGASVRSVQFGVMRPGRPSVVAPNSAQAGEYRITGLKYRKSVDISFSLPTSLTGPGGETIPLNFNGNTAALCELDASNTCVAGSYFAWNPVTTPTYHDMPTRYVPGRKTYAYDSYDLYIGGTATSVPGQTPGIYTGAIGVVLVAN